jgi:hypothetical protein
VEDKICFPLDNRVLLVSDQINRHDLEDDTSRTYLTFRARGEMSFGCFYRSHKQGSTDLHRKPSRHFPRKTTRQPLPHKRAIAFKSRKSPITMLEPKMPCLGEGDCNELTFSKTNHRRSRINYFQLCFGSVQRSLPGPSNSIQIQ